MTTDIRSEEAAIAEAVIVAKTFDCQGPKAAGKAIRGAGPCCRLPPPVFDLYLGENAAGTAILTD